jgi:hypothetical protein
LSSFPLSLPSVFLSFLSQFLHSGSLRSLPSSLSLSLFLTGSLRGRGRKHSRCRRHSLCLCHSGRTRRRGTRSRNHHNTIYGKGVVLRSDIEGVWGCGCKVPEGREGGEGDLCQSVRAVGAVPYLGNV